ncbi:MAG: S24/S26 family peptidase [Methanobacterium sp.]|uniref:S24/S26 family peptidase n=1 Tax=Methanobacterium sp. TaxID=2164 RepID=UPI003D6564E1|nr:S24/S26 family peptidase [Methanobacterium sp.]
MKSKSGLIIGILIIGVIAASVFYSTYEANSLGVNIKTNGTIDTTTVSFTSSPFNSPSAQMEGEVKNKILEDIDNYNSTVDSIKSDINTIARKYNYTTKVTLESQFGADQLSMPASVSGTSMVPTLQDGQNIMVLKTKDFKVDDIVVAYHPQYNLIVKRLKKIEGDRVYLMSDNRKVETYTTQKNLGNGVVEIDTIKKTPLDTWLPKQNVIGVVKVY